MSYEKFRMAQRLARVAVDLDESKKYIPLDLHATLMTCVESMHGMAQVLAGDRVGEIYDQEIEA